jgi:hypothetical protein
VVFSKTYQEAESKLAGVQIKIPEGPEITSVIGPDPVTSIFPEQEKASTDRSLDPRRRIGPETHSTVPKKSGENLESVEIDELPFFDILVRVEAKASGHIGTKNMKFPDRKELDTAGNGNHGETEVL